MSRQVPNYVECYIKFRGYGLQPTAPQNACISCFQTYQKYALDSILGPLPDPKMEKKSCGCGRKNERFGSSTRI